MAPKQVDKPVASAVIPVELKKLTVPQLKVLCKEKGLTGYSKLTKDVIILKLSPFYPTHIQHENTTPGEGTLQTSGSSCTVRPTPIPGNLARNANNTNISSVAAPATMNGPARPTVSSGASDRTEQHITTPIPASGKNKRIASGGRIPGTEVCLNSIVEPGIQDIPRQTNGKRVLPKDTANGNPRTKVPRVLGGNQPPSHLQSKATFKVPAPPPAKVDNAADQQASLQQAVNSIAPASQILNGAVGPTSTKRFKPLVAANGTKDAVGSKSTSKKTSIAMPNTAEDQFATRSRLDFPVERDINLKQIMLPPSIAGRKQAQKFAIILSGISRTELINCSLASKTLRYSAHLSAYHRLRRDFPGKRTESVLSQYNQNVTDAWPYLLQRQREVSVRKRIYEESFLGKAVGDWYVLSEGLWASPDDPKQAAIAVRFIMTRFYFLISVQGMNHPAARRQHIVTDCSEVVKDEIWVVKICSQGVREEYYVLEPTCEVIGCQDSTPIQAHRLQPRVDWSSYISQQTSGDAEISLFERLRWPNREEYQKGISKHWLNKMREEGQVGKVKVAVARKYILACVVANSISGKWMSSVEMAQEYAGLPSNGMEKRKARKDVQLYVPEHHHVESIHFTSAKGLPLHEALAVIQTPGREYFILRDNGMQVGCEEEGVGSVWMSILRCRSDGVACV